MSSEIRTHTNFSHSIIYSSSVQVVATFALCYWGRGMFQMKFIYNIVFVELVFYGPSTHFMSFRARWVILATLFLGKPPRQFTSLSAHSFASNWQLLSLNLRKGENGHRKFFMTKSRRKNVAGPGLEPAALWFAVRLAPYCARRPGNYMYNTCIYMYNMKYESPTIIKLIPQVSPYMAFCHIFSCLFSCTMW